MKQYFLIAIKIECHFSTASIPKSPRNSRYSGTQLMYKSVSLFLLFGLYFLNAFVFSFIQRSYFDWIFLFRLIYCSCFSFYCYLFYNGYISWDQLKIGQDYLVILNAAAAAFLYWLFFSIFIARTPIDMIDFKIKERNKISFITDNCNVAMVNDTVKEVYSRKLKAATFAVQWAMPRATHIIYAHCNLFVVCLQATTKITRDTHSHREEGKKVTLLWAIRWESFTLCSVRSNSSSVRFQVKKKTDLNANWTKWSIDVVKCDIVIHLII